MQDIQTRNESTFFLFHLIVQHCGILLICDKMSRTSSYSCTLFWLFNYIWKKFFLEESLEESKLKLDTKLEEGRSSSFCETSFWKSHSHFFDQLVITLFYLSTYG